MPVRPAPRPPSLSDTTVDDVKDACEEIHRAARERKWSIEKLADEAGVAWQSFNNWKQGHESPKVGLLQKAAAAVGSRIRVALEVLAPDTGEVVVKTPRGLGGSVARTPSKKDDITAIVDELAVSDPGIRSKAQEAAREAARVAAAKTVVEEYKRKAEANPTQPTTEPRPSRGRRKTISGT